MQTHGTQVVNSSVPDAKMVEAYIKANGQRPFTANQDMGGNKLTGLAAGSNANDGVNYAQMMALFTGAADLKKDAASACSKTNIASLSGPQTINAVAVAVGESVFLAGQTDATKNGLWTVNAGAWTRRSDANTSAQVTNGMFVVVAKGSNRGGYILVTDDPIVLETTSLTFMQVFGAAASTPTTLDKGKAVAAATNGDNANTGLTITAAPNAGSYVALVVSAGGPQKQGNGVKTNCDYYFSGDNGATARASNAIQANDVVYWNGVFAGFDLLPTMDVSLYYNV